MPDLIDASWLTGQLDLALSELRVQCLEQCESTNTLLMAQAKAGGPHGSVVVCEYQTAGRGRLGNRWQSAPEASLTFSLLWRFPSSLQHRSALSLVVAVGCAQTLESLGARGVALKWPNDLLLDGRKLGGILVETFHSAGVIVAVIGVGLNVCHSASIDAQVGVRVATLREAGIDATRTRVLAALLLGLENALAKFDREGFEMFRAAWQRRDAWHGRQVRLSGNRGQIVGEAMGIGDDGALLLRTGGMIQTHYSGEMSLRPA
ncbi:MAG: biotin--[acetyl-CoA-carboxylase] ligase [Burkholderiales bacterium]